MQGLRLYFPLFQATQLIGGVSSAYAQEIKKLRQFGLDYISPHLRRTKLLNYPFKIKVVFYAYTDTDAISSLIITSYIIRLLETNGVLQSNDYRVIPLIEVSMQKVKSQSHEGCELFIEHLRKEK